MSRFVYNLRYISSSNQKAALVKYIATREGVEKVTLSDEAAIKPASVNQKQLLQELLKEYPGSKGLLEYEDYSANPNMRNASSFISAIMDNNADSFFSPEKYIGYISQRPGVEKAGTHGLFSSEKNLNLQKVIDEVSNTKGNLYTGVLSLRREDAHALCYENATAWKAVIEKNLPKIAEAYKIPLKDLKWYAAFHNESHHPHCHMLIYSTGKEGYINKTGIENIKSAIATDIFRDDLSCIYQAQQESLDKAFNAAKNVIKDIPMSESGKEIIQNKLLELSDKLQNYTGKKVYGYLPKKLKALVNSIASELGNEPAIQEAYKTYLDAREKQLLIYHSKDTLPPREDILDNKKFKKIKNLIIKEAAALQHSFNISISASVPSNPAAAETSAVSLDTSDEVDKEFGKYYLPLATDTRIKQADNILNNVYASTHQSYSAALSLWGNVIHLFNGDRQAEECKSRINLVKTDIKEKIKKGEKISYDNY